MLFLGAFASGAILWGLWMVVIVQKTERMRPDTMTYPTSSNSQPKVTNDSTVPSNGADVGK